jgi:Domain of unknown function (DUF4190)
MTHQQADRPAPRPYTSTVRPTHLASPKTNSMAIASFVLAFFFWPLAIVFGHISLHQIRRRGEGGRGFALAGLIMGYALLAVVVLLVILVIVVASSHSTTTNSP